jgi:hypothetical protein
MCLRGLRVACACGFCGLRVHACLCCACAHWVLGGGCSCGGWVGGCAGGVCVRPAWLLHACVCLCVAHSWQRPHTSHLITLHHTPSHTLSGARGQGPGLPAGTMHVSDGVTSVSCRVTCVCCACLANSTQAMPETQPGCCLLCACKYAHRCGTTLPPTRPSVQRSVRCKAEFSSPVCGSDGVTYPNQ